MKIAKSLTPVLAIALSSGLSCTAFAAGAGGVLTDPGAGAGASSLARPP